MGKRSGIWCKMCIFLHTGGLRPYMGCYALGPGVSDFGAGGGGGAELKSSPFVVPSHETSDTKHVCAFGRLSATREGGCSPAPACSLQIP